MYGKEGPGFLFKDCVWQYLLPLYGYLSAFVNRFAIILHYLSDIFMAITIIAIGQAIFLEQPKTTAVEESDNATFRCALSNSSFRIHWEVNGSNAGFTVFRERGVTMNHNNSSSSELQIIGRKRNNNTRVQCIALLLQNNRVITYVSSNVALLMVVGK